MAGSRFDREDRLLGDIDALIGAPVVDPLAEAGSSLEQLSGHERRVKARVVQRIVQLRDTGTPAGDLFLSGGLPATEQGRRRLQEEERYVIEEVRELGLLRLGQIMAHTNNDINYQFRRVGVGRIGDDPLVILQKRMTDRSPVTSPEPPRVLPVANEFIGSLGTPSKAEIVDVGFPEYTAEKIIRIRHDAAVRGLFDETGK